jgi:hypothetical protein
LWLSFSSFVFFFVFVSFFFLLLYLPPFFSYSGEAISAVEIKTSQMSGNLWKRKKKKSNAPSSSKQRFCHVRVDGLHYYEAENGERLGVIEFSRIEDCVLLENGKTFDLYCNDGVVFEFTASDSSHATDWCNALKPKKVAAQKEGWLMKKKDKKGLIGGVTSMSKKRWCVLTNDSFKYFDDAGKGGRCLGSVPISEVTTEVQGEGETQSMKLVHGKESYVFAPCTSETGPTITEWVR